jgi:hypothetical protein
LIVGVFTAIGLAGLYLTRHWVRRLYRTEHNDIVGFYLAAITVFYGITLGLVTVGTWETYSDVQNKVDHEAIAVLQNDLRLNTRQVIDVGWPMQQRGMVPNNASGALGDFQRDFMTFEPSTERQKILAAEAYRAFNDLTESRRASLNSVTAEMPGPLWIVVIAGAILSIATTWFFHSASFNMHFWMTILFSALIGLLIYLVASLDKPLPRTRQRNTRATTARLRADHGPATITQQRTLKRSLFLKARDLNFFRRVNRHAVKSAKGAPYTSMG